MRREGGGGVGQGRFAVAGCHDYVRLMHDEEGCAILKTILPAAVFKRDAGGDLLGRGRGDGYVHGIEPVAGIFDVGRGGVLEDDFGVGGDGLVVIDLFESGFAGFGELHGPDEACFGLIGVAEADEDVVHVAVLRIGVDDGLVAGDGGGPVVVGARRRRRSRPRAWP